MLIKSLLLVENGVESFRRFPNGLIYIHSKENSKGKTTLLRLLFYSFGYQIPSMRGMDFSKIRTVVEFEEKGIIYKAERNNSSFHLVVNNESASDYSLPSEHNAFLKRVFQEENVAILSNILGFIYIDQDKGWSLLNRGTVIGKIKFNINELVAGLNDVDISDLLEREKQLEQQKDKYETIRNMQNYVDIVFESNGEFVSPNLDKEMLNKISYKKIEIKRLQNKIDELNNAINSQERLFQYIESLKLVVVDEGGKELFVNRENIKGALPNTELLKARKSILSYEIDKLKREITKLEISVKEQRRKDEGVDLLNSSSKHNKMYNDLNKFFESNQANIADLIDETTAELSSVRKQITNKVKNSNSYITTIYNKVLDYAKALKVDKMIIQKENYIFTTDLKSLSGTILSKIIFAFKLAFLKTIEEKLNTKLFMAIDSPGSKEMDKANYKLILDLINKELKTSQVFVASIFNVEHYNKKIELNGLAIEPSEE